MVVLLVKCYIYEFCCGYLFCKKNRGCKLFEYLKICWCINDYENGNGSCVQGNKFIYVYFNFKKGYNKVWVILKVLYVFEKKKRGGVFLCCSLQLFVLR